MHYRRLGRTGLQVSEISLGASGLRGPSTEYALRMVRRAIELGVNYFDTASVYGDSEPKLGMALEGVRREVFIATKVDATTAADAEQELAASLRRLRTDYVDVLALHDIRSPEDLDRRTAPGGAWEALEHAREAGTARFIGITGHRHDLLVRALRRCDADLVLFILNIVERGALQELIPLALERDIGLVVMKPLAMGALPPRLALRYILSHPVSCAIPGPTRLDWLEADIAAGDTALPLSEEELARIERLRGEHDRARCRLCSLCEPCPQGVRIAYALGTYRFYNDARNMGPRGVASFPWGEWAREHLPRELATVTAGIRRCDGCGQCEPRCPYGLPIVQQLRAMLPALAEMQGVVSGW